jgi:hypothetical protein
MVKSQRVERKRLLLVPNQCIYCGAVNDLTLDHVPPKLFFATPYPENLITVPACHSCNQSFQKDDEYTRTIASLDLRASKNPTAQSKLPVISRALRRPTAKGFAEYLASQTTTTTILNHRGSPLGQITSVDRERVNATGIRMIRGLHFFETRNILPFDATIKIAVKTGLHPLDVGAQTFARAYSKCADHRNREIGSAFSYVVGFSPIASVWLMMLYDYFIWMATVQTKKQGREITSRDEAGEASV